MYEHGFSSSVTDSQGTGILHSSIRKRKSSAHRLGEPALICSASRCSVIPRPQAGEQQHAPKLEVTLAAWVLLPSPGCFKVSLEGAAQVPLAEALPSNPSA